MKNKVIYLDFDGVINDLNTECISLKTISGQEMSHVGICPNLVDKVNEIHDNTGAVVWVHSSWREVYDEKIIKEVLLDAGLRVPYMGNIELKALKRFSDYFADGRGTDIRFHIEKHGIEKYVILDDMESKTFKPIDQKFHIQTDPNIGIQDHHVQRAIKILNS